MLIFQGVYPVGKKNLIDHQKAIQPEHLDPSLHSVRSNQTPGGVCKSKWTPAWNETSSTYSSWIGNFTKEGHNIWIYISRIYLLSYLQSLLPYACSKPCFNRGGFYQWLLNSLKVRATPALMSEMRKKLFIFVASLQGAQWTACNLPHLHLATFTRKVATWRFEV